jgi:TRAP-type C4-dicarboxylate transport system permease small subunit
MADNLLKKSRIAMCRLLEIVLILAVLVLVLDVLWGVLTRWIGIFVAWLSSSSGIEAWSFLPRGQNKYSEEIARFLLVWVSLLGGAVAFGEKAHLGVDYFVGKFDSGARKFITIVGQLVVLFFAASIFMIGGTNIAMNNMEQIAPALGPLIGLKMGHVYLALPVAGLFIILFTVEQMLETLLSTDLEEEAD